MRRMGSVRYNFSPKHKLKIKECYEYYLKKDLTYDEIYEEYDKIKNLNPKLEFTIKNIFFKRDKLLRIKTNLKIIKSSRKIKTFIFTNTNNKKKILKLRKFGIKILILNENSKRINLERILFEVAKLGFNNILLESGPNLNYAFLKKKLINKIYYFQTKKNIDLDLIPAEKK